MRISRGRNKFSKARRGGTDAVFLRVEEGFTERKYKFKGVKGAVTFRAGSEDRVLKLPRLLPEGCQLEGIKYCEDPLINSLSLHCGLWGIDNLLDFGIERTNELILFPPVFGLNPNEILINFCTDLVAMNDKNIFRHFCAGWEKTLIEMRNKILIQLEEQRPQLNQILGLGAEELTFLELRLLAGVAAKSGYLQEYVQMENLEFESYTQNCESFAEGHSCLLKPGEFETTMSPQGALFSGFFVDLDFKGRESNTWRELPLLLGGRVIEKMPGAMTTKEMRRIERDYHLKFDKDLPEFDSVILPKKDKERISNIIQFYRYEKQVGHKAALRMLFRGIPGSGKSMLSQAIAKELGLGALIVNFSAVGKDVCSILATFIERARKNNLVLILEECEDLISVNPHLGRNDNMIKIMFEDYEGIVIFTTNQSTAARWYAPTEAMERRMDLIVDFEMPGEEIRARILSAELGKLENSGWTIDITIGQISQITKQHTLPGGFFPQAIKQAASNCLLDKVLRYPSLIGAIQYVTEKSAAANHIGNASESNVLLSQVVLNEREKSDIGLFIKYVRSLDGKDKNPILPQGATIMLSGPPGAGKTMSAHAIANELGMPIRLTKASDFLSKWVGETEQNIVKIFRECERKKEILFVDEIEGLLSSRDSSVRNYEVTQINEFLKAIEVFQGIFIGATNHIDMIDSAFGRRFLFHVQFELPSKEERAKLWCQYLEGLPVSDSDVRKLAATYHLSGGEIRNVAVRAHVCQHSTFDELALLCDKVEGGRTGRKVSSIGI